MSDKVERVSKILGQPIPFHDKRTGFIVEPFKTQLAQQIDALYTERAGETNKIIPCKFEDWDDTTYPRPTCHCNFREGVDCANGDDIAQCPDYQPFSQPDPPAVSNLMLNSEDIETSLLNNLLINVHHGIPDTQMRKFKAIAKAQLKACQDYYQPLLTAQAEKIRELTSTIENACELLETELGGFVAVEAPYYPERLANIKNAYEQLKKIEERK